MSLLEGSAEVFEVRAGDSCIVLILSFCHAVQAAVVRVAAPAAARICVVDVDVVAVDAVVDVEVVGVVVVVVAAADAGNKFAAEAAFEVVAAYAAGRGSVQQKQAIDFVTPGIEAAAVVAEAEIALACRNAPEVGFVLVAWSEVARKFSPADHISKQAKQPPED